MQNLENLMAALVNLLSEFNNKVQILINLVYVLQSGQPIPMTRGQHQIRIFWVIFKDFMLTCLWLDWLWWGIKNHFRY